MVMGWQARLHLPSLSLCCSIPVECLGEAARQMVVVQVDPLHARESTIRAPWWDSPI